MNHVCSLGRTTLTAEGKARVDNGMWLQNQLILTVQVSSGKLFHPQLSLLIRD